MTSCSAHVLQKSWFARFNTRALVYLEMDMKLFRRVKA